MGLHKNLQNKLIYFIIEKQKIFKMNKIWYDKYIEYELNKIKKNIFLDDWDIKKIINYFVGEPMSKIDGGKLSKKIYILQKKIKKLKLLLKK